jgi:hypothetical protein
MPYHDISAEVSDADLQAVKTALDTVRQKLPFLVTLTPAERRRLYKMGDRSLAFVQNSLQAAQNNPGVLPASFDLPGFERDVRLAVVLSELLVAFRQMTSQLDDTLLGVGSEAMNAATEVYGYVKAAARKTPGLKPVAAQLGERFKKARAGGGGAATAAAK